MKLATTTSDFERYLDLYGSIKEISRAGFKYIDLGMTGRESFFAVEGDSWKDEIKRLGEYAESLGVKFVQAHSPNSNPLIGSYA